MISLDEQRKIASTIKALCTADHLAEDDAYQRQQLLFVGVFVALGDQLPPYWIMTIHCGRTDRLIDDFAGPLPAKELPIKAGD